MDKTKKGLRFYLHLYRIILAQDIKSRMSYRADFIISAIGMLLINFSGLATFWLIFQNFPEIMGWTFYEMLFLYGFSLLALTPVQCFFDNNWSLRIHLLSGDFIKYCFRPVNLFFYYMSEVFDIKGIGQFFFGAGLLAYAWINLQIPFSFLSFVLLLISFISASLFMIALMNMAAATGFWMLGSGFVMVFAFRFKDYARYPVTIFSSVFKFIFTFIIPIAFVSYYSSLFFLRPDSIPLLTYLSPAIGVLFFYLSYKLWMKGAMSYSGTGS